jgi:hypothetical protein
MPIVWPSGGIDKAQRRRWEGAAGRHGDERWQRLVMQASGEGNEPHRCDATGKRLWIATASRSSEQELYAQPSPNEQLTHGNPYGPIRSP